MRIGDCLALGRITDFSFAILSKGDDRGSRSPSLTVGNDNRFVPFHDSYTRVRGSKIDTNNFSHFD